MEKNRILNSDYLDILYDGKNKSYGGYSLRRNYSKRVMQSLLVIMGLGFFAAALSSMSIVNNTKLKPRTDSRAIVLRKENVEILKINPPPPPVAKAASPAKSFKVTPPVIKEDIFVDDKDLLPKQKNISKVGLENLVGDSNILNPEKISTSPDNVVRITKEEKPKIVYWVAQMPVAEFDLDKFLSDNLRYPEQAKDGNIQGRVVLKFVVNEDGSITDVTVEKGIGGGCDEEAKRVVASMPKWKPGKQNGVPMKVYYRMPINFKLEN